MDRLKDKVALITGGTSGIGEAIAKRFAEEGAFVVICGRDSNKGEICAFNINQEVCGGEKKVYFIQCDVTSIESVESLRREFCENFDHLDVLVNNAGILKTNPVEQISESEWEQVFDVNTNSVLRLTQKFLDLIEKNKGNILNVASIDGLLSVTRGRANYAYASSKAALIKFSQLLALNYTPKGIRINCLCPGVTETPIFTNRDFNRFLDGIPMGRVGQPKEIANAALFLASDEASYISGVTLIADGGASLK